MVTRKQKKLHLSKHTKKNHTSRKQQTVEIDFKKYDTFLLCKTIIYQHLFLIKMGMKYEDRKELLIKMYKSMKSLIKEKNMNNSWLKDLETDKDFENYFAKFDKIAVEMNKYLTNEKKYMENYFKKLNQQKNKSKTKDLKGSKQKGGFFFKDLEDKADQPITGTDITKFLDEVGEFIGTAQYTKDGAFLMPIFHLFNLFRGNTDLFKFHIKYGILPQYFSLIPPRINFSHIFNEIEEGRLTEIPNYLLSYQIYNRIRDEYLVAKGEKDPLTLDKDMYAGFFDKFVNKINDTYFEAKMKIDAVKAGSVPLVPIF